VILKILVLPFPLILFIKLIPPALTKSSAIPHFPYTQSPLDQVKYTTIFATSKNTPPKNHILNLIFKGI
jgi:hypothetical protein